MLTEDETRQWVWTEMITPEKRRKRDVEKEMLSTLMAQ